MSVSEHVHRIGSVSTGGDAGDKALGRSIIVELNDLGFMADDQGHCSKLQRVQTHPRVVSCSRYTPGDSIHVLPELEDIPVPRTWNPAVHPGFSFRISDLHLQEGGYHGGHLTWEKHCTDVVWVACHAHACTASTVSNLTHFSLHFNDTTHILFLKKSQVTHYMLTVSTYWILILK